MFCSKCGAKLADDANFCPSCGAALNVVKNETSYAQETYSQHAPSSEGQPAVNTVKTEVPACPDNHLVKSILFTILLCWPFGIPAIVNSTKVNTAYMNKEYDKAQFHSNEANKWCNVAMWVGIGFWILYALYMIVLVAAL